RLRIGLLIASGALGALAFPGADWSLFAWIWLLPPLCCGPARKPRAAPARRARGRMARRHRVLPRAPALARSHVSALQRDPVADHVATHRRARRVLWPLRGADRRGRGLAEDPDRRRGRARARAAAV